MREKTVKDNECYCYTKIGYAISAISNKEYHGQIHVGDNTQHIIWTSRAWFHALSFSCYKTYLTTPFSLLVPCLHSWIYVYAVMTRSKIFIMLEFISRRAIPIQYCLGQLLLLPSVWVSSCSCLPLFSFTHTTDTRMSFSAAQLSSRVFCGWCAWWAHREPPTR